MVRFLAVHFTVLLLLMTDSSNTAPLTAQALAASDTAGGATNGGGSNNGEVPQLPSPDPNSNLPRIRLGETIRLEEMGPIILNKDGSTRRIANWDNLSEHEKEVTWRRISKRNEERRQALLRLQEEEQGKEL